jgi:succinoglycan biosynthesis transport protein ExoP
MPIGHCKIIKKANNLVNTGNGLLSSQQLSDLNTQLTNAQIAVAEAKARLDGIHQTADKRIVDPPGSAATVMAPQVTKRAQVINRAGATTFAMNNSDIVRLRSEYRGLAAKPTELESDLGPGHFALVKLHKKMDELRTTIRDQEQLIADGVGEDQPDPLPSVG